MPFNTRRCFETFLKGGPQAAWLLALMQDRSFPDFSLYLVPDRDHLFGVQSANEQHGIDANGAAHYIHFCSHFARLSFHCVTQRIVFLEAIQSLALETETRLEI